MARWYRDLKQNLLKGEINVYFSFQRRLRAVGIKPGL